jgi:hypothetical protein
MAIAKSKLDTLHYRNERSMSFERFTEIMTKCFNTLHQDPDQRFSDQQKVEKLLNRFTAKTPNSSRQRSLSTSSIQETSSEPAVISCSKWPEFMDQHSWNTIRPNPANMESMQLIINQAKEAEDGVVMAAEADTEAGDDKAKEAEVLEGPTSTE